MTFKGFPPQALQFYAALALNNEKVWFNTHRSNFDTYVMEPSRDFVIAIGKRLRELAPDIMADPRVNKSIFRICPDTSFSKYVTQLH
jgi:uncharacterized protein (DUF2461 family)